MVATELNTVMQIARQELAAREAEHKTAFFAFCAAENTLRETSAAMLEAQAIYNQSVCSSNQ